MKTNRTLKLITLTAAIFGFAATSFGQNASASANASASVELITPLGINKLEDLDFGVLASSQADGTAVLTTAGVLSATGGVQIMSGTPTVGEFEVTGEGNTAITVTVPATVVMESGANQLTVALAHNNITALSSGTATILVGGTITIPGGSAKGNYTKTFTVTVDYN